MEINYIDFLKIGSNIIDIRDEFKYKKSHLPNSQNVEFQKLLINPEKYLNKNNYYLIVCDFGIKSKKTSEILNNNGYHTYSLKNGFK